MVKYWKAPKRVPGMPLVRQQPGNLSIPDERARQLPAPRLWANPEGKRDMGAGSAGKLVNPQHLPQHRGIEMILHIFRMHMHRQRGGERKKASVPEPAAGVICALHAKQQAHGFTV